MHSFAQAHDGTVAGRSKPGSGATMPVDLPLAPAPVPGGSEISHIRDEGVTKP